MTRVVQIEMHIFGSFTLIPVEMKWNQAKFLTDGSQIRCSQHSHTCTYTHAHLLAKKRENKNKGVGFLYKLCKLSYSLGSTITNPFIHQPRSMWFLMWLSHKSFTHDYLRILFAHSLADSHWALSLWKKTCLYIQVHLDKCCCLLWPFFGCPLS